MDINIVGSISLKGFHFNFMNLTAFDFCWHYLRLFMEKKVAFETFKNSKVLDFNRQQSLLALQAY